MLELWFKDFFQIEIFLLFSKSGKREGKVGIQDELSESDGILSNSEVRHSECAEHKHFELCAVHFLGSLHPSAIKEKSAGRDKVYLRCPLKKLVQSGTLLITKLTSQSSLSTVSKTECSRITSSCLD